MARAKPVIVFCGLVGVALCAAAGAAAATPLPIASQDEVDALNEEIALRRCVWAEGQRLCTLFDDREQAAAEDGLDVGYYGAPGIYLGAGNRAGVRLHGGLLQDTPPRPRD